MDIRITHIGRICIRGQDKYLFSE